MASATMEVLAHADVGPFVRQGLGVTDTATLALLCHAMRLRVRAQLAAWREQLRAAWPRGVSSGAARWILAGRGHLQVLQWMLQPGIFYALPMHKDKRICLVAVRGGHLEVLQWLREHGGCPWDKAECEVAARENGHHGVLAWIRAQLE